MVDIPKLPKLTRAEELSYKEKTLLIEIVDQFRNTHRYWYIALLAVLVFSLPLTRLIAGTVAERLIARHEILPILAESDKPADMVVEDAVSLAAGPGVFSAYAHIANPNANWSAWSFDYEFVFRNNGGVEFTAENVRWTRKEPDLAPEFPILAKRWGNADGNFFVEGVVKNPYSFRVTRIDLEAIIFDAANTKAVAVNSTVADDLDPFEERYFRMLWPVSQDALLPGTFGQVQVRAEVNPLEPGFVIPQDETIPAR